MIIDLLTETSAYYYYTNYNYIIIFGNEKCIETFTYGSYLLLSDLTVPQININKRIYLNLMLISLSTCYS